ncbi:MAG: Glycine betaine transport system permease protein opuAB [Clostridia bacterium 62_21]|nr:MAG: Glycine betaine transport system permease protein opuAB [Clostridia bacterium 62_21]HAG06864.1 glycine/betaine ABC transporter [Peptococcaceae bacterium]
MTGYIPLADWVDRAVEYITVHWAGFFGVLKDIIYFVWNNIEQVIAFIPWWVLIVLLALVGWRTAGRGVALLTVLGLFLIQGLGMWGGMVRTLSLVVTAIIICVLMGIPLGIWAARWNAVHAAIRPVLDFMQTMPSFVYLIPALMLFGLGPVPALISIVVFAMPPLVRLTDLGIRQVAPELVEAARAFGSTPNQILVKVQLPLALPTIMAGINQAIMLALSMSVIASMIGAGGLGTEVLYGITRVQVGRGFVGGISIVIVAVILDRLTQAIRQKNGKGV